MKELLILILASSFPVGYFLAWLTREELVSGRKYFILLSSLSVLCSLIIAFLDIEQKMRLTIILSLFYISIVSLISIYLSYNKRFVKC